MAMEKDIRYIGVLYSIDDEPELIPSEWANGYVDLIDFLRKRLPEFFPGPRPPTLDKIIAQLPTGPPGWSYALEVNHYLSLKLRTTRHRVVLRIDPYDLIVLGYSPYESRPLPKWFEFGIDETTTPHHLIHGSSLLGFHGDYDSLVKVVGVTREEIGIGPEQLVTAINTLAVTNYPTDRARALIVLTRMITDAIRDPSIPKELVALIPSGGGGSPLSLGNDQRKSYKVYTTAAHKHPFAKRFGKPLFDPNSPPGKPLAEVFSVVIHNMIDRTDLYGKIHVKGASMQELCIFNKGFENSVSISAAADTATSSSLLLTGPSKSIDALDPFGIYLVLKDRNRDDEVIIDDLVVWNPFGSAVYDTHLAEKVSCQFGSATVNYVVLSHAVQATLEVTLLRNNYGDEDHCTPVANIHGYIHTGSNCGRDDTSYWSVLFLKEKEKKKIDDDIVVHSGQLIPLLRSVVSVKLGCPLKVEAELFARGLLLSSQEHGNEIAKGTIEFVAEASGTSERDIFGKDGKIMVKVTWAEV